MAIAIALGVVAYAGFLAAVIWLSVRWSRRYLKARNDELLKGLPGAKQLGPSKPPSMYRGTETLYEVGGRRVVLKTYFQGRSAIRASLHLEAGPFPFVTVYPEGKAERFGKAIGLNCEVQTGDKAFDRLAYVDTIDTEENVRRLLEPAAARAAIADLLGLGFKVQLSKEGVEAFQVVAASKGVDGSRAAEAVAALGRLADALPPFAGVLLEDPRAPRRVAFSWLLVFSWLWGLVAIFLTGDAVGRTVDRGDSALVFVLGGGVVWAAYVALLAAGVRGRSYALRTVLVAGFVGLLGIPAGGGGLFHWLNQRLDEAPSTEHVRMVLEHVRRKNDCRLVVEGWHDGGRERLHVRHGGGERELKPGSLVHLRVHPGAFGLEWHEPVRPDGS